MADKETGRAPRGGPMAYGMAPVVTSGVLSLALLGGLGFGGASMVQQMAAGPNQAPAATSTPTPGSETTDPGSDPSDPGSSAEPGDPTDPTDPTTSPTDPTDPNGNGNGDDDGNGTGNGGDDGDDGGNGDPTTPGDGDGTGPSDPNAHPGHPGDPGDWEYSADGAVIHYVEYGDTLSSISTRYGVSVDRIAEYNSIRDVNLIYADSALEVPFLRIPPAEQG